MATASTIWPEMRGRFAPISMIRNIAANAKHAIPKARKLGSIAAAAARLRAPQTTLPRAGRFSVTSLIACATGRPHATPLKKTRRRVTRASAAREIYDRRAGSRKSGFRHQRGDMLGQHISFQIHDVAHLSRVQIRVRKRMWRDPENRRFLFKFRKGQ